MKFLCIVFEAIKFKALTIFLYGNRIIIYGCLSHRTSEQFFCTRCIYALLLPHCHKQNMLIQLLFLFFALEVDFGFGFGLSYCVALVLYFVAIFTFVVIAAPTHTRTITAAFLVLTRAALCLDSLMVRLTFAQLFLCLATFCVMYCFD